MLVFVLGILGNAIVLYATIKHKAIRLDAMSIWLIQNLAATDFMNAGIMVLPAAVNNLCGNTWVFGSVLCEINAVVKYMFIVSNFYLLNILQFNKVYRCHYPLRSLVISR